MARRKLKEDSDSDSDDDRTYRLKIYQFTKLRCRGRKPIPRSGHRIECTNTSLYSIGGYHPDEQPQLFREVWRFDFVSKTWSKLKPKNLPAELASCYTVLSGNLLFLYGGTGVPFGQNLNGSLSFCNLPKCGASVTFEEIKSSTFRCPPSRYGHSMALNGNHLYAVGGTTGHTYSMDVHEFDLETREWTKLYDCFHDEDGPKPRYRHEMVCYNDRLYIFGGGTSQESFSLEVLPAFNLKTNRWETFKTTGDVTNVDELFPIQRKCHGCVQNPHQRSIVYINGGSPRIEESLNDTWRIDLDTLKWTRIRSLDLPYGLHFHSVAATSDGRMIVFGGITNENEPPEPVVRTADLYSAWISIPKLADACWEAMQHYIRKGVYTLPENVKSFGLPRKYEDRLVSSGLLALASGCQTSSSTSSDCLSDVTDEDNTLLVG